MKMLEYGVGRYKARAMAMRKEVFFFFFFLGGGGGGRKGEKRYNKGIIILLFTHAKLGTPAS